MQNNTDNPEKQEFPEEEVSKLLIYLGITPEKQGYKYMMLVLKDLCEKDNQKLKEVYGKLNKSIGVSPCTLDSSIRNAIHAAYSNEKLFRLNEKSTFDVINTEMCPTNRELIMLLVNFIKVFIINTNNGSTTAGK